MAKQFTTEQAPHSELTLDPEIELSDSSAEDLLPDYHKTEQMNTQKVFGEAVEEFEFKYSTYFSRGLVITNLNAISHATSRSSNPSKNMTKTPSYYTEVSEFARNKPDVTLHSFPPVTIAEADFDKASKIGETGPVIGVAYGPRTTSHMKLGLGDPESDHNVSWINLQKCHRFYHGEYTFKFDDREYLWKRTRDPAVIGVKIKKQNRSLHKNNFQLIDVSTNTVLVVFVQSSKRAEWLLRGRLRVFRDLYLVHGNEKNDLIGQDSLKTLVFISLTIILEKSRRRNNQKRAPKACGGPY